MKVQNAVDKLDGHKGATAQLSIDASADQIWAALKSESGFSRSDATTLAGLRLTTTLSSDKPLKDVKPTDTMGGVGLQLSTDAGRTQAVEVRFVNKVVYLRADIKTLVGLGGAASASDLAGLNSLLGQADSLPASLGSVKAALQGQWISIDPQSFLDFAKSLDKSGGSPIPVPPIPTFDAATQQQVQSALSSAIKENAKFADAGSKDGVDHVTVTLAAGKAIRQLATGLKPLTKQIPELPLSKLDTAPDKNVTLDLAIKNGDLSGVTIDLAQFTKKPTTGKVPLHLALSGEDKPLAAPTGAKALNPQDIMGALVQLAPGLDGALGKA